MAPGTVLLEYLSAVYHGIGSAPAGRGVGRFRSTGRSRLTSSGSSRRAPSAWRRIGSIGVGHLVGFLGWQQKHKCQGHASAHEQEADENQTYDQHRVALGFLPLLAALS